MRMSINYSLMSKIYDLCEIFFFSRKSKSPRHEIINYIPEHTVKILDMCVGTATNSIIISLNRPNAHIIGVDISSEMLSVANKRIAKKNLDNLQMVKMDATAMEFDDNTFDIIIISLVLHEMGKSLAKKMLSEAKRVLKPSGKVLVIEWEKPKHFFQKLMFQIIRCFEYKNFEYFLNTDFNEYFKNRGFVISSVRHCDYTRIFELKCKDALNSPVEPVKS